MNVNRLKSPAICLFVSLLTGLAPLRSQNVSINSLPFGDFFVCDTTVQFVILFNGQGDTLEQPKLTLALPAGVEYIPGSIVGAAEENTSNLGVPIFKLADLLIGQTLFLTLKTRAACSLVAAINSAQTFKNGHTLVWKQGFLTGAKTSVSLPYKIETPLLVITKTDPPVLDGQLGELFTRSIFIKNTRLGALNAFIFSDLHKTGIDLSSPLGQVLQNDSTSFRLLLSAADFKTIGDHDDLFELHEIIVVQEKITITDCGIQKPPVTSEISVAWGCGGIFCQQATADALVLISPADVNPSLVFTSVSHSFSSICGKPTTQEISIKNVGFGPADSIRLTIGLGNDTFPIRAVGSSFRMDSAGQIAFLTLDSLAFDSLPACGLTGLTGKSFSFFIPKIGPGEEIKIFFDLVQCADYCDNRQSTNWGIFYKYDLICPPKGIFKGITGPPPNGIFTEGTEFFIAQNLEEGTTGFFDFRFINGLPADSTGLFFFDFNFPCGLLWNGPPDFNLNGIPAQSTQILPDGSGTVYRFGFDFSQLPPSDTLLYVDSIPFIFHCDLTCAPTKNCDEEFYAASCPFTCEAASDSSRTMPVRFTTYCQFDPTVPLECCPKICEEFRLTIDCTLPECIDTILGFVEKTISARRVSFGLPDNDDDRHPDDPPAQLDFSKIRRDRFLPYDTLETIIRGIVRTENASLSFPNARFRQQFEIHEDDASLNGADGLSGDSLLFRLESHFFQQIFAKIELTDASSGLIWECPLTDFVIRDSLFGKDSLPNTRPHQIIDQWAWMSFEYDLSPTALAATGCPVPPGFEFAAGDSIVIRARHAVTFDVGSVVNFRDRVFLTVFDAKIDSLSRDFSCNCPYELLQLTPVIAEISPVRYEMPNCLPTEKGIGHDPVFSLKLGWGNYFPHEFRQVSTIKNWTVDVPAPSNLLFSMLDSLVLQDGPLLDSWKTIPQQTGIANSKFTPVKLLFEPLNLPAADEGYSVFINQIYQTPCSFAENRSLPMLVEVKNFRPEPDLSLFEKQANPHEKLISDTFGLWPTRPQILATSPATALTTFGKSTTWQIKLANSGLAEAPNGYIFVENPTGGLADFQLKNKATGLLLPLQNGVWLLGTLPPNWAQQFELCVENNSCALEKVVFHVGWNCAEVVGKPQNPCDERVINLSVKTVKAELEMAVSGPVAPINLCDIIPWHTVEIFNALLGTAYDLRLRVELPAGFQILPGTCELANPTGSAWQPIGLPTFIGPGQNGASIFEWMLKMEDDSLAQNGLPGFQFDPKHGVSLRFLGEAGCGFAAGKQLFFQIFGQQNCPEATNTLKKATDPIQIIGVAAPYSSNIIVSPTATGLIGCATEVTLQIALKPDGPTLANDSVLIFLPTNVAFVSGSYQPGTNAPGGPPQLQLVGNQWVIKLKLPAGLPANSDILFSIKAVGFGTLGCGTTDTILIRTTQRQLAVCSTTGEICQAEGETGSVSLLIEAEHPDLALVNFQVNLTGGQFFNVQLKNNGSKPAPLPLRVKIFADTDGSGTWSAADQLVADQNFAFTLNGGATVNFSGSLAGLLPPAVCHLFAVLESEENCLCSTVSAAVGKVFRQLPPVVFCENETALVGFAANPTALNYQWIPTGGLAAPTASQTSLSLDNQSVTAEKHDYLLRETFAADCFVDNLLGVTVHPVLPGFQFDTTVCQGEPVLLWATSGDSVFWQGPGILAPNQLTQWLFPPLGASQFLAFVTDSAGCTRPDSFDIFILEKPLADAGPDQNFCSNQPTQLVAANGPGWIFEWSPASFLNDAEISNPLIINGLGGIFALKTSLPNGCFDVDTVQISIHEPPILTISPQPNLACTGDTILLKWSPIDSILLTWNSTAGPLFEIGSDLFFVPAQTGQIQLFAEHDFGCRDSVLWNVVVPGANLETAEIRTICEGETTDIFGTNLGQAGNYCQEYSAITGCDSTHCINLNVLPKKMTSQSATICSGQSVEIGGEIFNQPGQFCSTLEGENGCDSVHCVIISALDTAVFSEKLVDKVVRGDSIQLFAPPGFAGYEWSPASFLSCSDCPNPIFTAPASGLGSLIFTVKITNSGGCAGSLVYAVRIFPVCSPENVRVPNAFTPNGDGLNDRFQVFSEGFETLGTLEIFDRWGEKVWAGDARQGWDGNGRGKNLPTEVYVWRLAIECASGEEQRVGGVTLIK